jgi:hypothetical protein
VTCVMWNLVSVCLEIVLVSVHDRSIFCAKCTTGSEIVLDAPDGTQAQGEALLVRLEIVLIIIQDRCIVCTERTIGSEIVMDAPSGAPR